MKLCLLLDLHGLHDKSATKTTLFRPFSELEDLKLERFLGLSLQHTNLIYFPFKLTATRKLVITRCITSCI